MKKWIAVFQPKEIQMKVLIAFIIAILCNPVFAKTDYVRIIELPSIGYTVLLTEEPCVLNKLPTENGMTRHSAIYFNTKADQPTPIKACWITTNKDPATFVICRENPLTEFSCEVFYRTQIKIMK